MLAVGCGVPAVIVGALAAPVVGGAVLLALSGVVLLGIGIRMVVPPSGARREGTSATDLDARLVALVVAAAFLAGLLANGGGFLLVPIFVLVLGFTAARAAGTPHPTASIATRRSRRPARRYWRAPASDAGSIAGSGDATATTGGIPSSASTGVAKADPPAPKRP